MVTIEGACCAHSIVARVTISGPEPGTVMDAWACCDCGARFSRDLALPTFQPGPSFLHEANAALRAEVAEQAGLIKRLSDLLNSAVNVLRGPPPDDTLWSFHDVAERAEALRARVAELEADAEAGRKLWSYMVENELPWSDPDLQDALTDIGLLVAKDMSAEGSGPECDNCIGDCGTCYRVSKTLLVQRATESA